MKIYYILSLHYPNILYLIDKSGFPPFGDCQLISLGIYNLHNYHIYHLYNFAFNVQRLAYVQKHAYILYICTFVWMYVYTYVDEWRKLHLHWLCAASSLDSLACMQSYTPLPHWLPVAPNERIATPTGSWRVSQLRCWKISLITQLSVNRQMPQNMHETTYYTYTYIHTSIYIYMRS